MPYETVFGWMCLVLHSARTILGDGGQKQTNRTEQKVSGSLINRAYIPPFSLMLTIAVNVVLFRVVLMSSAMGWF